MVTRNAHGRTTPTAPPADHLADADFTRIDATWFSWQTECPDFETWWQLESGAGPYKPLFDRPPHVFDRFYRAVAARSTPGSGLGLAIVAQTVAQHDGTVTADARHPHGTSITITLSR